MAILQANSARVKLDKNVESKRHQTKEKEAKEEAKEKWLSRNPGKFAGIIQNINGSVK